MSNAIISERMIQYRLAALLGMAVVLPKVVRFYDVQRDATMMAIRANGREVHIAVPGRDLMLPMDEFEERHLVRAVSELAMA